MRLRLLYLLPATLVSALQLPNLQDIQSFVSAFSISLEDYIPPSFLSNSTDSSTTAHDLLRRQFSNTCPTDFHPCNNLGAPGLCCASAAVCSADANGNVACCPTGAVCTGAITGVITGGTVNSDGSLIGGGRTGTGTSSFVFAGSTTTQGLVPASVPSTVSSQQLGSGTATRTGGGFIIDGTSTVASPGAGVRGADVVSRCDFVLWEVLTADCSQPLFAKLVMRALEYLPI